MTEFYSFGSSDSADTLAAVKPSNVSPAKARRIRPPGCASDNKRRQALRLFESGFGYKAVADLLDLAPYTVRDWLRAFKAGRFSVKLSNNQYRYSEEIKLRVIALRSNGLTWRQIEETTGVKASTCRTWVSNENNKS